VSLDWGRLLVGQLEFSWDVHLRPRLEGLTDEEYFWEPVEGCWSLRRDAGGRWRLVHVGATCLANRASVFFGDGSVPADADVPHAAEIALLRDLYRATGATGRGSRLVPRP
jgi:hypothetical protein